MDEAVTDLYETVTDKVCTFAIPGNNPRLDCITANKHSKCQTEDDSGGSKCRLR